MNLQPCLHRKGFYVNSQSDTWECVSCHKVIPRGSPTFLDYICRLILAVLIPTAVIIFFLI